MFDFWRLEFITHQLVCFAEAPTKSKHNFGEANHLGLQSDLIEAEIQVNFT